MINVQHGPLAGLKIISPNIIPDARGYFFESYQQEVYLAAGLPAFVQENFSVSKKNVLRGLHYQLPRAQGKLVWVSVGIVWDVAVDVRLNSKTFMQWFAVNLSEENHLQFYIPPGFAHGFCVLSDNTHFHYKCTDYYDRDSEHGIAWDDPQLNIPWPIQHPILSEKDKSYTAISELSHDALFT